MKRSELIHQYIAQYTYQLKKENLFETLEPLKVERIAEKTGILPNNVSTEARKLFASGILIRVGGRPAYYLDKDILQTSMNFSSLPHEFKNFNDFLEFACPSAKQNTCSQIAETRLNPSVPCQFDHLIGKNKSLKRQIEKSKAALLYPPHGLHTLLTGPTGTGKSLFARNMHDFAVKSGAFAPSSPFIAFNCANYAENPQLLLSLLFGHIKGAFTGASSDRIGMVEHADGGILFLDEVHRLTPEGQEKMFYLMDRGAFNRLGESGIERHANVLIICATTANPDEIMLDTFQRRIPVQIALPALNERSIDERLEMLLYFIWNESKVLGHSLCIDFLPLCALCYYDCPSNIGQLRSDIKLICANSNFSTLMGENPNYKISEKHLHTKILQGLYTARTGRNSILTDILKDQESVCVSPEMDFTELLNNTLGNNY